MGAIGSDGAPSRRRVIGVGAASVAAAWAAPAIISVDAASAATDPPPPAGGTIAGTVTSCGNALDQEDRFLVTAVQVPGGATGSSNTNGDGSYGIPGLPGGTYDITIHPNGPGNEGRPDQSFPGAAVVVPGSGVTFDPDYTENGC